MSEILTEADFSKDYKEHHREMDAILQLKDNWKVITFGIEPETGVELKVVRTGTGKWFYMWVDKDGLTKRLKLLSESDDHDRYDGLDN